VDTVAVVLAALEPPPERLGVTHWSSRLLARELGVSHVTVAKVWKDWDLQPWRIETFKFSTDPELEAKLRDVVGLHLNPPEKVVVLCVDEKSQVQALDRTRRSCRCGRASRPSRPTTTCGTAPPRCSPRSRSPPARSPTPATRGTGTRSSYASSSTSRRARRELHIVVDNYATHKHPAVRAWLAKHPRITLHFTPTSGSWLNMVEIFFGIITRQAIRRGSFTSVKELIHAIEAFIDGWNDRCQPFTWTKSADELLPHCRPGKRTSFTRH